MLPQLNRLYLLRRRDGDRSTPPDVPRNSSANNYPFRNNSNKERQSMVGIIARKWIDALRHRW
jgi:hypothetical protein